ncbi:MAG: 2-oxo acid dehydrogenase subunit E2, partial [Anaerolineae bacterium]|nr:2-oxo acid dehydrogenase subunit E2 [Anaerolineae bacterium]
MAEIVTMPKLGFDMAEGTLVRWAKAEGELVEKGELLAEIETDKATVEVESLFSGTLRKHLVEAGAIVPVNNPIAVIGSPDEDIDFDGLVTSAADPDEPAAASAASEGAAPTAAAPQPMPDTPQDTGRLPDGVRASPLARRMAEENNLDLAAIAGTGPNGRITKRDVEAHLAAPPTAAQPGISAIPAISTAQLRAPLVPRKVPMSRLRRAIGRRMVQAKQELPHFYVTHEYDIAPVMDARRQANEVLSASGEKLSVNDFIVKAAALALRQFPNLNASLKG